MSTKVSPDTLDSDYRKAVAIVLSGFNRGRYSRPQMGFVKGTLDRLHKAIQAQPQGE